MRKQSAEKKAKLAYQRAYYRRRQLELFQRLGGKCVGYKHECNETETLHVDHINPTGPRHKTIWMLPAAELEKEIPLVQLLCPSCHTRKTMDEIAAARKSI